MDERIGRYELLGTLGEGGSARVYEAVLHGPLGFRKQVALKVLDASARGDRFREARLGANLQHPNVVATFDVEHLDGRCCIAMELVRGISARALSDQVALSDRCVVEIGLQVASGLAHIHAHGLVHRDVKPANLLVSESGVVKITDLGIARREGEHQKVSGTFGYMPIEQCEGGAVFASDLFAFGATLYRLRTGKSLFGRGRMAIVRASNADAFLATSNLLEAVPHEGLRALIRDCVRTSPDARPASALAVVERLTQLVGPGLEGDGLAASMARASVVRTRASITLATRQVRELHGRAALVLELARAVHATAWVTVTGAPGIGKTALVQQLGSALGRPLVWVDLDGVQDRATLLASVGEALGRLPAEPAGSLKELLVDEVLVLDHVDGVPGWPELVAGIERPATVVAIPSVALHPMGLGERRLVVPPLDREAAAAMVAELTGRSAAGALLDEVDGNPLLIELVASRMDPTRSEVTRSPRHASLERALSATWRNLPEWMVAALAQLAAFHRGFTPRSAAGVLDVEGPPVLEVLEALQGAGLLRGGPDRFSLGRHVRRHAVRADPRAAQVGRARHGRWMAQLGVRSSLLALQDPARRALREEVVGELQEIRAAHRRALEAEDAGVAHATALAAAWVYLHRGPTNAAIGVLDAALRLPGPRQDEVLLRRSYFALRDGDLEHAVSLAARCRELAARRGKLQLVVQAELRIGQILLRTGEVEDAREALERGLRQATTTRDSVTQAIALFLLSSLHTREGRHLEALEMARDCVVLFAAVRRYNSRLVALTNIALLLTTLGRDGEALDVLDEAERAAAEMGNERRRLGARLWRAEVLYRSGDAEAALALLVEDDASRAALDDALVDARAGVLHAILQGDEETLRDALVVLSRHDEEEAHIGRIELAERLLRKGEQEPALVAIRAALRALQSRRWSAEVAQLHALEAWARREPERLERARALIAGHDVHPLVLARLERVERALTRTLVPPVRGDR